MKWNAANATNEKLVNAYADTHHGQTMNNEYTYQMWKHQQANGYEMLITAWFNAEGLIVDMTIAERPSRWATWGPPNRFEKVEN